MSKFRTLSYNKEMKDKRSEIWESLILPCSQPSRLLVTLFLRLSARARICRLLSWVYHKRHHKNRTTRSLRILQKKMRFVLMELWKNSCDAHAKNHSIYVAPGDEISYYVHDDWEWNEASSSSQKAKTFFWYFWYMFN